jgi:type II secretory pathway pseudopilin PulG
MKRRVADESGITLVELLFVMLILGFVLAGIVNVFVSGTRASQVANARLASQQVMRASLDRLEYEVRCSSGATVSGGGSTVVLTLPSQCPHLNGTFTWCVSGGALTRYTGSSCSGTGEVFMQNVTSATPFTLLSPVTGQLPRLQIALSVNPSGGSTSAVAVTDVLTLRNGIRT